MPKERYDDRQLSAMAEAAAAMERVMRECGYRDLLYGKWSLLDGEMREEHRKRDAERAGMFAPPARQLIDLMRWNSRYGWGFSDDDLRDIEREIPPAPPAPEAGTLQLKARVLEICLPDGPDGAPGILRTFTAYMAILVEEQGFRPFHLFETFPRMALALAGGRRHEPGLRWRTIDLGAHWPEADPRCRRHCGTSPYCAAKTSADERPHAGLLAAMAHFPTWVRCMDGKTVPRVWLPGYVLEGVPAPAGGIHHLRLEAKGFSDHPPMLYYGWEYVPFEDTAVPAYVDAETKTDP